MLNYLEDRLAPPRHVTTYGGPPPGVPPPGISASFMERLSEVRCMQGNTCHGYEHGDMHDVTTRF